MIDAVNDVVRDVVTSALVGFVVSHRAVVVEGDRVCYLDVGPAVGRSVADR